MKCLPEPYDRLLFQEAVTQFYEGRRATFLGDASFFRMQSELGRRFMERYTAAVPLNDLNRDYQQVFSLFWEMRQAKG